MKKFKIASICLGAALVSLVICGYTLQNKISVQAEVLTTQEACVQAFGKKGRRLFKSKKNKIYPIKCTIQNNGSSIISLSLENIDLKMVPRKTIMQKLAHSNFNWQRSLKILGLGAGVLVGCVVGGCLTGAFLIAPSDILNGLEVGILLGGCVGVIAAPTTMVVYGLTKNNQSTKSINNSNSLALLDSLDIKPGRTGIFFLFAYQRDLQENFSMKFTDEHQNSLSYNVQLPSIII